MRFTQEGCAWGRSLARTLPCPASREAADAETRKDRDLHPIVGGLPNRDGWFELKISMHPTRADATEAQVGGRP